MVRSIVRLCPALFLMVLLSSCYVLRAYRFRKLKISDTDKMPSLPVNAPATHYIYPSASLPESDPRIQWLDQNLDSSYTAAFIVIRNDSILYEKYFDSYGQKTLLPSYSVIKSFVSTLVDIALAKGKIRSLQQPVTDYIPELRKNDDRFANISIQNLLDMRSGIKWKEGTYGLKDDAIKLAFRPNMMKYVKKLKIDTAPSADSNYKSINTMLLSIVVTRATGKTLNEYLQNELWQPLGMESNATLITDKHGMPIGYAGLNAIARDYAKFGSLFLHKGYWNGKQLVSKEWVNASVSKDSMGKYSGYRNQWWGAYAYKNFSDSTAALKYAAQHSLRKMHSYTTGKEGKRYYFVSEPSGRFYAEGILGQFVCVDPQKNIVVVRFGHYWQNKKYSLEPFLEEVQNRF